MRVEKFTPGPWKHLETKQSNSDRSSIFSILQTDNEFSATYGYIADVYVGCVGSQETTLEEGDANAHLIAAAPELYEALYELTDLVDALVSGEYRPDSFTTQPAHAALKKARGEA